MFKKFAMFVLMIGMLFSFGLVQQTTVSADSAVTVSENTTENNTETMSVPVVSSAPVATKQPVVTKTPARTKQPVVTKTPARTKQVKKTIAKSKKTKKSKVKKTRAKYKKSDLRLMASIINCEAGGESYQGQVAVGIVVMNRVRSKQFPNTIRKVIYQRGQFSPVRNGMLRKKLAQYDAGKIRSRQWKSCIKAAKTALNGQTIVKIKGKTRSMKGVRFFSVGLPNAKFRLGGHRFK